MKPEEEELVRKRDELSRLETDLADRELYLTALRSDLSLFDIAYAEIVGKRFAELDEIEAQIAELIADASPRDESAKNAATQARSKARESRVVVEESLAVAQARLVTSYSQTLKSLYREIAKRIHPDLATGPADRIRRQQLMAQANKAYEEGDEAELRAILEEYEASPESVQGEGTTAELVRVIRKIAQAKNRLVQLEREVQELEKCELFELKTRVDSMAKEGRDLLQEMAVDLEEQISVLRERLNSLTGKQTTNGPTR